VNQDFRELLQIFSDAQVRYLIIGGYAVIKHAEPRYTKDLDLWVSPDAENAERVYQALTKFGAPIAELKPEDFTQKGYFFTMGLAPSRVDVFFDLLKLDFEECWQRRVEAQIGEMEIYFISREDLIINKEAVGRLQDLADAEKLRLATDEKS
jgi:hypothetical protein